MTDQPVAPVPKKRKSAPRKRKPAVKKAPDTQATLPASMTVAADEAIPATGQPALMVITPAPLISVPLSVRWRDLDAFNHVNNSKYLSYLEEARLRWMMTIPGMGLEDDIAPVVAASNLNYRRPVEWPAEVVVELFVERLGSSSVTIGHRIIDASDKAIVFCDGHVVMVWIDRQSGRPAPLPNSVREACG